MVGVVFSGKSFARFRLRLLECGYLLSEVFQTVAGIVSLCSW